MATVQSKCQLTRHEVAKIQQQMDRIRTRSPLDLFAEYTETYDVTITRKCPDGYILLLNYNNTYSTQLCPLLFLDIVRALDEVISAGIHIRSINLLDILININARSMNRGMIHFMPPLPHQFQKRNSNKPTETGQSLLQSLAEIFYIIYAKKGINYLKSDRNWKAHVDGLADEGFKAIINWMVGVEREWVQTDLPQCLRELQFRLQRYEWVMNEEMQEMIQEQAEQQQEWFWMFQMDIFTDIPPIFYADHQKRASYFNQESYFQPTFHYIQQGEILQIRLQHKKGPTLNLRFDKLHPFLQTFFQELEAIDFGQVSSGRAYSTICKFYKWIDKADKMSFVSPAGKFSLRTHVNWVKLYELNNLYRKVSTRKHQNLAFNNSHHYEMLSQAKIKPFQRMPQSFKGYLKNHCGFLRKMAFELFREKKYGDAGEIFRCLIETQYQLKLPNASMFKGRGSEEDMLDLMASVSTGDSLPFLQSCESWDCLFVSEYLGMYSQRNYEWYQQMLQKYPSSVPVLYGLLNYCHLNDHLIITVGTIRSYHSRLYEQFRINGFPAQPIKMLLANIAYFKLEEIYIARKWAYEILLENTANISAKKMLYLTTPLPFRIGYLQQLVKDHPHYQWAFFEGFQCLKNKEFTLARQRFEDCLACNPYFREAYYGLIQVKTQELTSEQIELEEWWRDVWTIRANLLQRCLKDTYLSFKIWQKLQHYHQSRYLAHAKELQQELTRKNPTVNKDSIKYCSSHVLLAGLQGRNQANQIQLDQVLASRIGR